ARIINDRAAVGAVAAKRHVTVRDPRRGGDDLDVGGAVAAEIRREYPGDRRIGLERGDLRGGIRALEEQRGQPEVCAAAENPRRLRRRRERERPADEDVV